jgi:hypothetical protein
MVDVGLAKTDDVERLDGATVLLFRTKDELRDGDFLSIPTEFSLLLYCNCDSSFLSCFINPLLG